MAIAHEVYTGDLVPSVSIDIAGRVGVSISVQAGVSTIVDVAPFISVPGTSVLFNLGKLIFNQIGLHAEYSSSNISVGYPSLIFGIMASQNVNVVLVGEKYEKYIEDFSISKKLFQGHHVQDIQGELLFPHTPSVSKGVATPMSQDDVAVTLRFLKADLAFLEALERSIAVRKKETIAFISKLESAGASSSFLPPGSGGVSTSVQPGVPDSSAANPTSTSTAAADVEDPALVDKSSI